MKRFPKSAAGILPRAQAGGLDLRLLNVLVLVALALALLWRGEWLGLLSLPIVAWLGSRLAAREPNVEAGPPPQAGLAVMLEQLLPVWARLHDAMDVALQDGSEHRVTIRVRRNGKALAQGEVPLRMLDTNRPKPPGGQP